MNNKDIILKFRNRLGTPSELVDDDANFSFSDITKERVEKLWSSRAGNLFANQGDFEKWLDTPNSMIEGQIPVDLLIDDEGYQLVGRLLDRIEYGVMA